MPLITTISDELVALELGAVVARGEPQAVVNDPRVIEGYLGTSDAAINRSGPGAQLRGAASPSRRPDDEAASSRPGSLARTLLLVVAIAAQGANDVARVDNVGWWSKRPAAQPISGPTSFEVASGPDGDESVAALRILIDGSVTKATLSLTEVANMGTAAISVPKLAGVPHRHALGAHDEPRRLRRRAEAILWRARRTLPATPPVRGPADITSMLAGNRSEVSLMVVPRPTRRCRSRRPSSSTSPRHASRRRASPMSFPPRHRRSTGGVAPVTPAGPSPPPDPPGRSRHHPRRAFGTGRRHRPPRRRSPLPAPRGRASPSTTKTKHWDRLVYLIPLSALRACSDGCSAASTSSNAPPSPPLTP